MPWTYRPALDGLRSVAVYLVLFFHAGVAAAGGGFIGVDLFFVLSGFLVTNVLLSELDAHGRIRLPRFYARRVRRLLPAALVVVVATSAVFMLVTSVVRRLPLVADAQSALLYVANWNFIRRNNDYFAGGVDESPFLHFWSLAIEEQFYVVFPLLLLVLVRASRRRRWVLPVALAAVCGLSLAAQAYWASADATWAYYGTDARLYQLVAGSLLAVWLRSAAWRPGVRAAGLTATAALGLLVVLGSDLVPLSVSARGVAATVVSVAVIAGLMLQQDGWLGRLLSRKAPVYLGQVSYGTYLWHWPVILLLEQFLAVRPVVLAVLALVVSTSLASLSYQLLELPLRTATVPRLSWSTVGIGLVASAVMAVSVVPATLASERRPRLDSLEQEVATAAPAAVGGAAAAELRNAPVPDIDYAAYLGGTGPQPSCTRENPRSCVLVRGDGPHLALVGDSQAKMLGPMFTRLAREKDLTLSVNVLPACPWQADVVNTGLPRARARRCEESRRDWYETTMPRLAPDLVVLVSGSRDLEEMWEGVLQRSGGSRGRESLADLNFDTMTTTVRLIESQGPRVLLVDTLPTTGGVAPLECLARAARLHQCEVPLPARSPASDAYYRVAAERSDRVFTVDLTPIFCVGAPRCLPVVDDRVVWRDPNHLSVQITKHFRHRVWSRIQDTGALAGL